MLIDFGGHRPRLAPDVFVAPGAVLVGRVQAAEGCTIWFGAVLRADNDEIVLGARSNVQDGCVLHVDAGKPVRVGEECVVGHRAVLHGCTLGRRVLVGIGAVVLNGAVVEDEAILGAGSLVPEGKRLESGYLYLGVPARRVRPITREEREWVALGAAHYVEQGRRYRAGLTPGAGPSGGTAP